MTSPGTDTPGAADLSALPADIRRIYESESFAQLRRTRGGLARTLAITMCVIYFGFISIIAFKPAWLAIRLDEVITLGLPVGLFVILSAIALTGVYVSRANARFDQLSAAAVRSARS